MLVEPTAYVSFDGNVAGPQNVRAIGCSIARTGVGLYQVTLDRPLAGDEIVYDSMWIGGAAGLRGTNIQEDSAAQKTIVGIDGTTFAPSDDFSACVAFSFVTG